MSELDSSICITSVRATAEKLFDIYTEGVSDVPNPLVVALAQKKTWRNAY